MTSGKGSPLGPLGSNREELAEARATHKLLPFRYLVREDRNGRGLTCVESPNISVRLERGLVVTAAAARRAAPGTIFLDGAAQGEPFLDAESRVYNLDHHEGCVRSFTLATCEQAMVVLLKGLDMRSGEWQVVANEPDFDTVLAIWLLLNHIHVTGREEVRRRLMPLVRLEGVVDAHGLELEDFTGFPDLLQQETLATLQRLRGPELELKRNGQWQSADLLQVTAEALHELDRLVYSPRDFDGLAEVEELARLPLTTDRMAVVCRSRVGIYEAERHLRRLYGDRVGLVVLENAPATYTLRQADAFMPRPLDAVYERLNQLDPGVDQTQRWGGSADIGGSPRGGGTRLGPFAIAQACQWVYRPPSLRARLGAVTVATLAAAAAVATAVGLSVPDPTAWRPGVLTLASPVAAATFAPLIAGLAMLLLLTQPRAARASHFGLRRPAGFGWLTLLPALVAAALAGGACLPGLGVGAIAPGRWAFLSVALSAMAWEAMFRGVVHGLLVRHFPIQRPAGPFFLSVPTLVAALASAAVASALFLPPPWLGPDLPGVARTATVATAALLLGLLAGSARERWASLLAPAALHAAAAVVVWTVAPLLPG